MKRTAVFINTLRGPIVIGRGTAWKVDLRGRLTSRT
jgi:hypothetical protein